MYIEPSFLEIAVKYKVIFFDAYGVLKNSGGVVSGVPELLIDLRERGIDFFVITNDASRSPEEMARVYQHPVHGDLIPTDRNISSGTLAREFLVAKVKEGRVAYLGKPSSTYYIEAAGLEAVPISDTAIDDPSITALVLLDDEGFNWQNDLNRAINLLRHRNIPVVVANTDRAYPVNSKEVAVAIGGLANMMEDILRKEFIRFGKPDSQMFSYTLARARENNPGLVKSEILMVGDTLTTDILGANKFGIDTMLVLSGNTQAERAELLIGSTGILPNYICPSVMARSPRDRPRS